MLNKIREAYQRISVHINRTNVLTNTQLDDLVGCKLFFKLENEQYTGSFKLRGAASKLGHLQQTGYKGQIVTASTGNHAAAVIHMATVHELDPVVFVPKSVARSKLEKLQKGCENVTLAGEKSGSTEQIAIAYATDKDLPFIHPYNDEWVIAGQGTIALELLEQVKNLDAVIIPAGGGGMISGMAVYIKSVNPSIQVIGAQPLNASELAQSVEANRIVDESTLDTISDGTAGGLDPETVTVKMCQDYVDRFVTITEEELLEALKTLHRHTKMVIEPAAALSFGVAIKLSAELLGKRCGLIICGAGIDQERFNTLLNS